MDTSIRFLSLTLKGIFIFTNLGQFRAIGYMTKGPKDGDPHGLNKGRRCQGLFRFLWYSSADVTKELPNRRSVFYQSADIPLKEGSNVGKFSSDVIRNGAKSNLAGCDFLVIRKSNREGEEAVVGRVLLLRE